jgi:putative ABC transport system permease protein
MDFIQNVFSTFVTLIPVTLAQSLILAFVVLGGHDPVPHL